MTERTPMGYCEGCPMAAWLNLQAEAYIADAPLSGIDDNTVEILSMPDDLTDEEIADAARAFSMTDREAIRYGVPAENIDEMKRVLSECYTMLGNCALASNCQGKVVHKGEPDTCPSAGAKEVYDTLMKAFEVNIMGIEN